MDSNNKEVQDTTKKKAEVLISDISKSKKELEDLRKSCPHKESDISKDPDCEAFSIRKICKICKKVIGYPSKDELKEAGYGELAVPVTISATHSS